MKTIKESDPRITGEAWKTTDRKAVEIVLHGARVGEGALTPQRISLLSGVELAATRTIIKSLMTAQLVVNAGTPQQPKYRWRSESQSKESYVRDWGRYVPSTFRPSDARPGADDASLIPSMVNGVRIPNKRPVAQCVGVLADRTTLARD